MNMYADDHQFYVVRSTLSDVHDDLAVCAESASSWYRPNLLKGKFGQVPDNGTWLRKEVYGQYYD